MANHFSEARSYNIRNRAAASDLTETNAKVINKRKTKSGQILGGFFSLIFAPLNKNEKKRRKIRQSAE